MLLNVFNVERVIGDEYGEFDDSIYVVSRSMDKLEVKINSLFNWEELAGKLIEIFPQADFEFMVIGLVWIIKW